jgi:predicted nucleotidyltransferase
VQAKKNKDVLSNMLSRCVRLLEADGRVEGAYVVGSMADATFDDYSDIDLYVVVKDEHYAQVYEERFRFAEQIGDVLSTFEVQWPNCQMLGAIYRNYVEIDLCYTKLGEAEVFSDRYKIVLDRSGKLQKTLLKKEYPIDVEVELKNQADFAIYNVLHAIAMLNRGECWASIKQIEMLRRRIVSLMDLSLKRDVAEEYRRLESSFPPEVEKELRKTLCLYKNSDIKASIVVATQLFCRVGQKLADKRTVKFPSEKFAHLLKHL